MPVADLSEVWWKEVQMRMKEMNLQGHPGSKNSVILQVFSARCLRSWLHGDCPGSNVRHQRKETKHSLQFHLEPLKIHRRQ